MKYLIIIFSLVFTTLVVSPYKSIAQVACEYGKWELTFTNGTYCGEVKNGEMNGWGTLTLFSGEIQKGEYKNNKLNGQATVTYRFPSEYAGQEYVGMFKDSVKHGKGRLKLSSGEIHDGEFRNNLLNGHGQILYVTGDRYVGMLKNNKRDGQGTVYFTNGRVQEGIWKDDQFQYVRNNTPQPEARPPITVKKPPDDDEIIVASSGSGFAVSSDGYVITNNHVIDQCQQVNIHYQGNEIPATVVTYDKQNDLALLKADFNPETVFSLASNSPGLLQDIYVAGYPFGLGISSQIKVTRGIISSLTGINNNFSEVQIDAAIQGGNSGGPIVDEMGNVVGVAVAKLSAKYMLENYGSIPENTNFGVKINLVKNILESNNIKILSENKTIISKPELAKRVSTGTYYISCGMTMALIEKLKTQKVFFNHLD
ncbi:trypsin-like peptidase domain-containing protein [Emcibacteraceae bacterium]|nr:trypsin-like peptidase domain-containing protein [Emcibacteraceae bacterium]